MNTRIAAIFCVCFLQSACAKGLQGSTGDGGATGQQETSTGPGPTAEESTSSATSACVPGSTQLCNGPGACVGSQYCALDGTRYEPCICNPASTTSPSTTTTTTTSTGPATTSSGENFTCDPQSPGAVCGPGKQCIPQSNSDPVCSPAGNGNMFDLCVDFSQCLPGLDCVNDGLNSCCMAWCRLNYNDCPSGFSCVEVLGNPTVNGTIYGICWDGYPCVL